jgi:hypothetical protein
MPTTNQGYKSLALSLLAAFEQITKEHMAMAEAMRDRPNLLLAWQSYPPQATQAVEAAFGPLRTAITTENDFRPALEALLKLPG